MNHEYVPYEQVKLVPKFRMKSAAKKSGFTNEEIKAKSFLKLHEVAYLLAIHPSTAYQLTKKGKLPGALKVGGQWLFHRETLEKVMNTK